MTEPTDKQNISFQRKITGMTVTAAEKASIALKIAQSEGLNGSALNKRVEELKLLSEKALNEKLQSLLNGKAGAPKAPSIEEDEDWDHMDVHFSNQVKEPVVKKESSSVDLTTPLTLDEVQDFSIEKINQDVAQGLGMVDSQDDGFISESYNDIKEVLKSDMAKSSVKRALYLDVQGAELMERAKSGDLTKEEYYEAIKRNFLETYPNREKMSEKQLADIAQKTDTLTPAQVKRWQSNVFRLPAPEAEGYDKACASFNKYFEKETTIESTSTTITGDGMKKSVKQILPKEAYKLDDNTGKELMTFEQVFALERGVEFKKENIEKFNEKSAQFALMSGATAKAEKVHSLLDSPLTLVKGNNSFAVNPQTVEVSDKRLNTALYESLKELYGNDREKINKGLQELSGNSNIEFTEEVLAGDSKVKLVQMQVSYKNIENSPFKLQMNSNTLASVSENVLKSLDDNHKKLLNGKTMEQYSTEMADSYKEAYGSKNAAQLASAYVQDQEGAVKTVRAGVEYTGTAVMVGGMLFFPPAALAGGAISSLGGAGVEMLNEGTRENVSKERMEELGKELITNSALMGVGFGAGAAGSSVKGALLASKCPKLVAAAADIGTDAVISLTGDLALTGQINLEGEGFSQVMALVAGHRGKIVNGLKKSKSKVTAETPTVTKERFEANTKDASEGVSSTREVSAAAPAKDTKAASALSKIEVVRKNQNTTMSAEEILNKAVDSDGRPLFDNADKYNISETMKKNDISPELLKDVLEFEGKPSSLNPDKPTTYGRYEVSSLLEKIDTPEKKAVLSKLLNAKEDGKSIFDKHEIDFMFYAIHNDFHQADEFVDLAFANSEKIKDKNGSVKEYINSALYSMKTDSAFDAYKLLLKNNGDGDFINSSIYDATPILSKINSKEDLELLELSLKNTKEKTRVTEAFRFLDVEGSKDFYKKMLNTTDAKGEQVYSDYDKSSILHSYELKEGYNINPAFRDLMLEQKMPREDIKAVFSLSPERLESSGIKAALESGQVPRNVEAFVKINPQSDIERKAFDAVTDANIASDNKRFEQLGMSDIVKSVKTEEDVIKLNKMLQDPEITTHDLVSALKNGGEAQRHQSVPAGKKTSVAVLPKKDIRDCKTRTEMELYIASLGNGKVKTYTVFAGDTHLDKAEGLFNLKQSSPKRFEKLANSGVFELIAEGKISKSILNNIDENTFLSNRTLNEIKKMKSGEPYIKEFENNVPVSEFLKQVPDGEVGAVNGNLYVNDNGKPLKLDMTKETYEKLFPQLSRVTFKQEKLGDCWLISTMDSMMDTPAGRVALYKTIHQEGNDILVKFPDSSGTLFKDGKVLENGRNQVQGPPGFQLIEQAYAVDRYKERNGATDEEISNLTDINALMQSLHGGLQKNAVQKITGFSENEIEHKSGTHLENKQDMREAIENYANNPDVFVTFGTVSNGVLESVMSKKYDLYSQHAYALKGYNKETGMVYITNPWHTKVVTEVPLYELMKNMDFVTFTPLR